MEDFNRRIRELYEQLSENEKKIVDLVWKNKDDFIKWPKEAILFKEGCTRKQKYHKYTEEEKRTLKEKGIKINPLSNGPAIMAFLLADGIRPQRKGSIHEWPIHHIYDGNFPFKEETLYAVNDEKHFTQSAGLVAIHPVAHALADECAYFSWLLRKTAFDKFGYDPDNIFSERIDVYGFKIS